MERFLNKPQLLFWTALAFMVIIFVTPGCKSTRHITRVHLIKKPFEELYGQMQKSQPDFSFLKAKIVVNYKTGKHSGTQFKAQVRIRKDSLIWCSIVPAMGIEVARIEITRDSVKLINRMKKNFTSGSFVLLDSLVHASVGYEGVQAILLGNEMGSFQHGTGRSSVDGGYYKIQLHSQPEFVHQKDTVGLIQTIWLDPVTFRIRKMYIKENNNGVDRLVKVYYDGYQEINGMQLPTQVQIQLLSKQKLQINLLIKKIELVKTLRFPFAIPSNYVKL